MRADEAAEIGAGRLAQIFGIAPRTAMTNSTVSRACQPWRVILSEVD